MDKQNAEALDAVDSAVVAVGQGAQINEDSNATGVYKAVCTGPVEERRQEYIFLRDTIAEIEAANLITRLMYSSRLAGLKKQLDEIPVEEKWQDTVLNLVTTVGGNNMLDNHLSASAYTAAWYMGLISATSYTTGPALTDTMASHGGWAEDVNYSNAARPTTAWSAAASKSKSLSTGLVFNMNGATTIKGCFLNSVSTKSGTTGVLFSAGLFTGGDQPVVNGNTLTVTYTASV